MTKMANNILLSTGCLNTFLIRRNVVTPSDPYKQHLQRYRKNINSEKKIRKKYRSEIYKPEITLLPYWG